MGRKRTRPIRTTPVRPYAAALTRQELEDLGIVSVVWDPEHQEYWIDRLWYKNKHGGDSVKIHKHLKITMARGKRKYTQGKVYPAISFSYNGKNHSYSLSKFIYAWFRGEVPAGYVVDHKDNNPFNNTLDNLQLLTKEQNNVKRFLDNPECTCFNQYHNTEYNCSQEQFLKDWDMWEEWKKSNESKKSN